MRPSSSRAPNPDYQDPRTYLARGLTGPDGQPREALLGLRAMATGRELLMRAVPLEVVGALAQALTTLGRSDASPERQRAAVLERSRDPRLQRHPLLVRLLQAGAAALKTREDALALARHLVRIHQLATFERVLGRAIDLEQAAARQRAVRAQALRPRTQRRPKGDG